MRHQVVECLDCGLTLYEKDCGIKLEAWSSVELEIQYSRPIIYIWSLDQQYCGDNLPLQHRNKAKRAKKTISPNPESNGDLLQSTLKGIT
jgi:hypothetical protein